MRYTIMHHATGETLTLSRDVATTHPAWVHGQMGTDSEAELQWALDQYGEDAVGSGPDADGVAIEATDNTDLLRQFVATSGLTPTELSRVLGRDDRTMRRWLAGEQDVPDTLAQQVARLRVTAVDPEGVHLTYTR